MKLTIKKAAMEKLAAKYRIEISPTDMTQAITDLGGHALKLYMYYYTKSDGWIFRPVEMAAAMGVSVRTMQYAKKELIDKQYLFIDHEKRRDHYYLGPKMVAKFKKEWRIE